MTAFLIALVEDPRLAMATVGALAMIAGSVTPWAHINSAAGKLTENGLDIDGKITVLLGIATLLMIVVYTKIRQRDILLTAAVCSLAVGGFAVAYEINLRRAMARVIARMLELDPAAVTTRFGAQTGIGIWIAIAGASLVLTATLLTILRPRPAPVAV